MAKAYPPELRERVIAAREQGLATTQVAQQFSVSPAWVRRVMQRKREHGQTSPKPLKGRAPWKIDPERLGDLVRDRPDATLHELREALGVACSLSGIWKALSRLGFSFKKRRSMLQNAAAPTSRLGDPSGRTKRLLGVPIV